MSGGLSRYSSKLDIGASWVYSKYAVAAHLPTQGAFRQGATWSISQREGGIDGTMVHLFVVDATTNDAVLRPRLQREKHCGERLCDVG